VARQKKHLVMPSSGVVTGAWMYKEQFGCVVLWGQRKLNLAYSSSVFCPTWRWPHKQLSAVPSFTNDKGLVQSRDEPSQKHPRKTGQSLVRSVI
jgi:hypothetical protein